AGPSKWPILRPCISRSFFFFQAEDGIRDFHVTGVQTCALPIYRGSERHALAACDLSRSRRGADVRRGHRRGRTGRTTVRSVRRRSEERRVGKEWIARASPEE